MTLHRISRRTAIGAFAAIAGVAQTRQGADDPVALRSRGGSIKTVEKQPPLSAMLPATRYYEVESTSVGARFAVWVTIPPRYESEPDKSYPAIYQTDGNFSAPLTAPLSALLRDDPINPIVPFIQVSVGYAGEDAKRELAVRARDLLPPGEPLMAGTNEESMARLVKAGALDPVGAEIYLHNLRNPAGDKFLSFLNDELHPWIASQYRVNGDATGLHGYSYGGLFATYAALRRSRFLRIGAGSPGIISRVSKTFEMYNAELTAGADHHGRHIHMTVGEREITAPYFYQVGVGDGTMEFMILAGQKPLKGLTFTTHIQAHDSHASGYASSWFSFLRACYAAPSPTDLLSAPRSESAKGRQ